MQERLLYVLLCHLAFPHACVCVQIALLLCHLAFPHACVCVQIALLNVNSVTGSIRVVASLPVHQRQSLQPAKMR